MTNSAESFTPNNSESDKLWNRTDCCGERLSAFYVLVSDNPFNSTDLTTTINQAGVSSYYTAGPAGLLTEIGVGRSGRYVRVQLAGDNYLQLAEVEVMAGTAPGAGVKWLMTEHLGSTRMVIDHTGSLGGVRRHDFGPFGEEISAGVGIRSTSNGYGTDTVRQKFTQKERDSETGTEEQSVESAKAEAKAWIDNRISAAADALISGDATQGLFAFGEALHTIQDNKHGWVTLERHFTDPNQIITDLNLTPEQLATAERDTRDAVNTLFSTIRSKLEAARLSNREVEERLHEIRYGLRHYH
jgi:hypothetical protein